MKYSSSLLGLLLFSAACASTQPVPTVKEQPPATQGERIKSSPLAAKTIPVTNTYHGVSVVDDYRWLENWEDPKVKDWSRSLDKYTRTTLAALPNVAKIGERVSEVLSQTAVSYDTVSQVGKHFFAIKHQPPLKQPLLVSLSSLHDISQERVILDPNILDTSGSTTIDFYRPSPNGKMIAVSLSKGGSESGDVYVYETETGKTIHEVVPRVNGGTAGGDLVWHPNNTGFYYTRYPRSNERPASDANFFTQVYFHQLGMDSSSDRYEIGKDFPRIAEIELTMHKDTGRLLATVQKGDGGEFAHYIRAASKTVTNRNSLWRKLTTFGDKNVQIIFGTNTDLLVLSTKDAPHGKILKMSGSDSIEEAKLLIPEGRDSIVNSFWGARSIVQSNKHIYVTYQRGGPSELRVFDTSGKPVQAPTQLPNASASAMSILADGSLLFSNGSWTTPSAYYQFTPVTGKTRKTALAQTAPIDLSSVKVIRDFAISKDGTQIPVNIMLPKGTIMNGSSPAIVTGYGGYGINLSPKYRARNALYLEQGFIVAVVNLRGGSEFGESWHLQGNLTNKQNVFDDFAAALTLMVDEAYTSTDKLIIQGGSNGGLLMGAIMTQHPDMVKAVVSHVGIYDMLRVELSPNGAFNITEFGTVTKPEHFKALYAYSPYHHVVDKTDYPALLLLTGANDPRVDPMQSRKFAARMRAASNTPDKVLLRTSFNTGHGGGTPLSERIAQGTDILAFILSELGQPFKKMK